MDNPALGCLTTRMFNRHLIPQTLAGHLGIFLVLPLSRAEKVVRANRF